MEKRMQETWECLLISVRFGNGDMVISVTRAGFTIFENRKLGIILEYIDTLKSEGWEVVNVYPKLGGGGEMYELIRLVKYKSPKVIHFRK